MTPRRCTAAAPGSIGNVGPGFDVLGLAIAGVRDVVTATLAEHGSVRIVSIEGAEGLPTDAASNTAGIAAERTRLAAGRPDAGVDLEIRKGIPLASGVGGSAASAAAAAFAVNQLLDSPLRTAELIGPCVEAEAFVAGRHADNVAPSLLGGLVLVRTLDPQPRVQRLPVPRGLTVVVVTPHVALKTSEARGALPADIPLGARSRNASNIAAFVSACYTDDVGQLAGCIEDDIVEAARLPLIPGARRAIEAARTGGAIGASISGGGPSVFAMCHSAIAADAVRKRMVDAFAAEGIRSDTLVCPGACPGATLLREGGDTP